MSQPQTAIGGDMTDLIPPDYRTSAVCDLHRGITATGEYGRVPVLLDALQDEGAGADVLAEVCRWWVLCDPESDEARLRYAGWLEECGGTALCPKCNGTRWRDSSTRGIREQCPCTTGTVSNGHAERAEFIRVQCELAVPINPRGWGCRLCTSPAVRYPAFSVEDCGCTRKRKNEALRERERELLNANAFDWVPNLLGEGAQLVVEKGGPSVVMFRGQPPESLQLKFDRGFIDTLTLSWEAWAGGPCER